MTLGLLLLFLHSFVLFRNNHLKRKAITCATHDVICHCESSYWISNDGQGKMSEPGYKMEERDSCQKRKQFKVCNSHILYVSHAKEWMMFHRSLYRIHFIPRFLAALQLPRAAAVAGGSEFCLLSEITSSSSPDVGFTEAETQIVFLKTEKEERIRSFSKFFLSSIFLSTFL